jgi:hypothetical protein
MRENEGMDREPGRRSEQDARRRDLKRRLRLAFLEGAETRSRDTLGRGLTHDELRRVIERFPTDVSRR